MSKREEFKTDNPGGDKPILPSGGLLNKYGNVLNGLKGAIAVSGAITSGFGGNMSAPDYPLIIGIVRITGVGNTCPYDPDEGESNQPCKAENKYPCVFRYWDQNTMRWADLETELRVEAGAYWYAGESPGYGSIPTYLASDVTPAIYDTQRKWCIPLQSPPEQMCVGFVQGSSLSEVPKTSGAPYYQTVTISLEHYRNFWQEISPALHLSGLDDNPENKSAGGVQAISGSMPTMVPLRDNDLLRLTCGTTTDSGDFTVVRAGIRITLAGRIHNGAAECIPEARAARAGFLPITNLGTFGSSTLRFKDALEFQNLGSMIKIRSYGPEEEWAAKIEFFATIVRSPESSSVSQSSSSSSSSSSSKSSSSSTSSVSSSSSSSSSSSHSLSTSSSSGTSVSSSSSLSSSSSSSSGDVSSGYICITIPGCVSFNETTCDLTVMYGILCWPSDLGLTWTAPSLSIPAPC